MLIPNKKEWIAVVIVIIVVAIFMGSKFFNRTTNIPITDQINTINQPADQTSNINTATTTNSNKPMNTTADGLVIKDTVIGTGAEAKLGNLVDVNYTGKFADGKVFDSSIPRGQPIQFQLGAEQVIAGWDQGILGMKVGGKRSLIIPSALGYGPAGRPPVIPANATLYFDVELVAVQAQ